MKIVLGDFNAHIIGRDNEGWVETMGQQDLGELNDNGKRLLSYCSANKLRVGSLTRTSTKVHGDHQMDCQPN